METLYKITCNINNKYYIGSTNDFERRIEEHKNNCKDNNYSIHYKRCPELYME